MKKTGLTIILTALAAVAMYGQSAYEACLFSENNYEGTARSVAMGNAFTALGGDLGSIGLNPAGSAVAGYSQFSITPSITISSSTAGGVLPYGSSTLPYFEKTYRSNQTKFAIPNFGMTLNFETGRKSGVKMISMGFIANRTNSWCENVYANGTNYTTSFAGAAADDATQNIKAYNMPGVLPAGEPRYSYLDFIDENSYNYYSPWKDIIGYRSGIFTQYDDAGEKFIGATEVLYDNGDIQQGGPVNQSYGRNVEGSKYEYIFNIGANISDFIYIGFNLGLNTLSYDTNEYFKEKAVDRYDFVNVFIDGDDVAHTTYFDNLTYKYSYSASGTGVYGKFGIIVTPGNGLRIGAAVQTPTRTTIQERWIETGSTEYSDSQFSSSAQSPTGESRYTFRSPFRANFGIAYTLGRFAALSADYELADYGGMKYKIDRYDMSEADIYHFDTVNDDIKNAYGVAHQFRAGAEVKPLSQLAIRAGYNLTTSAQVRYYDVMAEEYLDQSLTHRHSISLGLGYSSKNSFFADLALKHSFATNEYYMPYSDYQYDINGNIVNYSPEILIRTSAWRVLLTLGWRF